MQEMKLIYTSALLAEFCLKSHVEIFIHNFSSLSDVWVDKMFIHIVFHVLMNGVAFAVLYNVIQINQIPNVPLQGRGKYPAILFVTDKTILVL